MYSIYKVENDESISSIASKFGIDENTLKQLNGITNSTTIYPGSYLLVPRKETITENDSYNTYIVKPGDNVYAIAQSFGIPYETLLKINGLNEQEYIYPNQQLLIPKQNSNMYMTTGNETIQSLYERYRNNWEDFLNRNQGIYLASDQIIQE